MKRQRPTRLHPKAKQERLLASFDRLVRQTDQAISLVLMVLDDQIKKAKHEKAQKVHLSQKPSADGH